MNLRRGVDDGLALTFMVCVTGFSEREERSGWVNMGAETSTERQRTLGEREKGPYHMMGPRKLPFFYKNNKII